MEQMPFGNVEINKENPEPRCACVLLLDTSGSMTGSPINQLNDGLVSFKREIESDSLASMRVEVAVVTFGGGVTTVQDFIEAGNFQPPTLNAEGDTPMGSAIEQALDMVEQRKGVYRSNGLAYFRPWVFMITDGAPTDAWSNAAARVKENEAGKKVSFFAVGVQNADMATLQKISVRAPLKLDGLKFRELFVWLSKSLGSSGVSGTAPGGPVNLQSPSSWATVEV